RPPRVLHQLLPGDRHAGDRRRGRRPARPGRSAAGCARRSRAAAPARRRGPRAPAPPRPAATAGPGLGGRPARRRLPHHPDRRPTMNHPVIPVVIIGAGPTGLTAATLLAQHGVECLVLDRWDSIYPQPRAVHLDDEVYRILARLGIRDEFAAISRPCLGLRLVEPDMTVLAELQRDAEHGTHGYPQATMFEQPDLEALLRANLARYPSATLRGGLEVTALTQDGDE